MTKRLMALVLAFPIYGFAVPPAVAPAHQIDLKNPANTVEFLAVGTPSALKIRGKVKDGEPAPMEGFLKVEGTAVSGTATCKLNGFDTGIELRNKHMKEKYLHVDKHPTASLKLTKMTLPASFSAASASDNVPFDGELTLHGQTKPVKGTAKVDKKADKYSMAFEFRVALEDFGIETPGFMGIKVTDKVTVFVNVAEKTGA